MKHYLLTWYGITDLKSALKLEKSGGPIISAFAEHDYTDVVLLGYTDCSKKVEADVFQKDMVKLADNQISVYDFIGLYANTEIAHQYFVAWLTKKLTIAERKTTIHFRPVALEHLNDTQNIYEASKQAMQTVANCTDETRSTLYLSPGTPVMAFVWSFIYLSYPQLKKRLIASSNPNKPPENIQLPMNWLDWYGKRLKVAQSDFQEYDIIFHLFGQERMPSFLGMHNFDCKHHVFITSPRYPIDNMKTFLTDAQYNEITVDPYNPDDVRTKILAFIKSNETYQNNKIGFNLTGGTKLMYAGAFAACKSINATPFYFESQNHKVIYLNDFHTEGIKPIERVNTFIDINSNNLDISKDGYWIDHDDQQRNKLTKILWQYKNIISSFYSQLVEYNNKKGVDFNIGKKKISVSLTNNKVANITIKDNQKEHKFDFQDFPDFAQYLCGGWFEEYTYLMLQPLLDKHVLKDIRIGLTVSYKKEEEKDYQELDIVLTDGKKLYIIECKAGMVKAGYISKLQTITRYFGGREAEGILISCAKNVNDVIIRKAEESPNVTLYYGDNIFERLHAYFNKRG